MDQPRPASALPTRRSLREHEGSGQATGLATPPARSLNFASENGLGQNEPATRVNPIAAPVTKNLVDALPTRRSSRAMTNANVGTPVPPPLGTALPVHTSVNPRVPAAASMPATTSPHSSGAGLTRAQLRELARGNEPTPTVIPSPASTKTTANPEPSGEHVHAHRVLSSAAAVPPINAPAHVSHVQAPAAAQEQVAPVAREVEQHLAPVPVPRPAQVPAAVEPSTNTMDVLAEVEAVMAQVEARIAAAGTIYDDEAGPLVLHAGREEPVDTLAPRCPEHDVMPVEPLNVIPGTSVVLPSESSATNISFAASPSSSVSYSGNDPDGSTFSESAFAELVAEHNSTSVQGAGASTTASTKSGWAPRLAVLGSIGLATVAVPILAGGADIEGPAAAEQNLVEAAPQGPSTIDLVGGTKKAAPIPAEVAQSVSEEERTYLTASRTEEREVLRGCDSSKLVTGSNGGLKESELCQVVDGELLQPEAAVAFTALNEAYTERFGHSMCLVDGYRNLESQYAAKRTRGSFAAPPGLSNHGWGYAIDICADTYQSEAKWAWLHANAPSFGWALPDWASRSYEPWHWEYTEGVESQK